MLFAIVSIAIVAGVSIVTWTTAPDKVPSHFNAAGQPDDWSSKNETLWLLVPLGIGLPVLMSIRALIELLPPAAINAPHRDAWIDSGNGPYLYDCLIEFLRIVAGLLALLFAVIILNILRVAGGAESSFVTMLAPTALFLVGTGLAIWNLYRRLAPAHQT